MSPVQLSLVILGPATLLCTALLTAFVVKSVVSVIIEERQKVQSVYTKLYMCQRLVRTLSSSLHNHSEQDSVWSYNVAFHFHM